MTNLILRWWPIFRFVVVAVTLAAIVRFGVRVIPVGPSIFTLVILIFSVCLAFCFCFLWPWVQHLHGLRQPSPRFARFLLVFGLVAFTIYALGLFSPPTFDEVGALTGAAGLMFGSVTYLKKSKDNNPPA